MIVCKCLCEAVQQCISSVQCCKKWCKSIGLQVKRSLFSDAHAGSTSDFLKLGTSNWLNCGSSDCSSRDRSCKHMDSELLSLHS